MGTSGSGPPSRARGAVVACVAIASAAAGTDPGLQMTSKSAQAPCSGGASNAWVTPVDHSFVTVQLDQDQDPSGQVGRSAVKARRYEGTGGRKGGPAALLV